jgi:hypothetical protein
MTIGAFVIDGDSGYDAIHEKQSEINCRAFEQTHDVPRMRKYRMRSDVLQLLTRARYRISKRPAEVVGLETTSRKVTFRTLKMRNSLRTVRFRFEIVENSMRLGNSGGLPISFRGWS